MDLWKAGAPRIDMLSPDLYNDVAQFSALYTRNGNPLFVPEANGAQEGAARALYLFGRHDAIGSSVFLIESNPGGIPRTSWAGSISPWRNSRR